MNRGRYAAPRRRRRRSTLKPLLVAMAVVLLIGCVAGGTLAWLTDTTDDVTNTFTTSDINITLEETTTTYKMIPGWTIAKDPVVTVVDGSEDCWLFVKVEKSTNFDSYMTFEIADGWTKLEGASTAFDVYYRKVLSTDTTKSFSVLKDNQVSVLDTVTKSDMTAATTDQPTLTFQAAAVQLYKDNTTEFTEAEAYAKVVWPSDTTTPDTP